jgi:hypothetical protein
MPDAVVLRAYPPRRMWWLMVPFLALAVLAVADGAYAVAPVFLVLPLVGLGAVRLILINTTCAFDGPRVARRRGRHWQGPIDIRSLDALGYTPRGTIHTPRLWMLGQPVDGDRPGIWTKSGFTKDQWAAIADLRFVPLYAAGGFLSPGLERLLARHVDRRTAIVGRLAEERVWPG